MVAHVAKPRLLHRGFLHILLVENSNVTGSVVSGKTQHSRKNLSRWRYIRPGMCYSGTRPSRALCVRIAPECEIPYSPELPG